MLRACVMLALMSGLAGCGGDAAVGPRVKIVPLTGTISLDGKPHGPATVRFVPQSADGGVKTASAEVKADGTFAATTYVTGDGIAPGKYDVELGGTSDAGSIDPAQMMSAIQGASIENTSIDVPEAGLTDVEIKLTTAKGATQNTGDPAMLGQ